MESYKHQFAKETVARWLADPCQKLFPSFCNATGGGPYGGGVFLEYPVCVDRENKLHGHDMPWNEESPNTFRRSRSRRRADEIALDNEDPEEWRISPPSYERCLELKLLPIVIFDVLAHHKGTPFIAVEIIHKNDLSELKEQYLGRVMHEQPSLQVYGVDADWVLSQAKAPKALKTIWTWGARS